MSPILAEVHLSLRSIVGSHRVYKSALSMRRLVLCNWLVKRGLICSFSAILWWYRRHYRSRVFGGNCNQWLSFYGCSVTYGLNILICGFLWFLCERRYRSSDFGGNCNQWLSFYGCSVIYGLNILICDFYWFLC